MVRMKIIINLSLTTSLNILCMQHTQRVNKPCVLEEGHQNECNKSGNVHKRAFFNIRGSFKIDI